MRVLDYAAFDFVVNNNGGHISKHLISVCLKPQSITLLKRCLCIVISAFSAQRTTQVHTSANLRELL